MQFQVEATVNGVSMFEGTIDGKELKSGTLFIMQPLDESKGNAKGSRTVEEKCLDSEIVKRIKHNDFPLKCRVVYERVVSKNSEKMVVVDCVPIGSAQMPPPEKKVA